MVVGRIINYDQFVAEKQIFDDKPNYLRKPPQRKFDIVSADEVSLVKFIQQLPLRTAMSWFLLEFSGRLAVFDATKFRVLSKPDTAGGGTDDLASFSIIRPDAFDKIGIHSKVRRNR